MSIKDVHREISATGLGLHSSFTFTCFRLARWSIRITDIFFNQVWRINRERAVDYLNTRNRIYVIDGFAGWDERYRINVRVVCARAYHALFMRNMLIRPTREQLEHFHPDYTIYNAGAFPANRFTTGMTSATSVSINFAEKEMVILGTEYAGEMKKGKQISHHVPRDPF